MCSDLGFLANLPELCDVTFLVGTDKEPVCAVKAILAARKAAEKTIFKVETFFLSLILQHLGPQ